MTTTRFFNGARSTGKMGEAARMKKLEIMKGGKLALSPADRYKRIMRAKLQEYQEKNRKESRNGFELSVKARRAMEEIAKRKAMKEEKALRQMVVIKPRRYGDSGHINAKGQVYDEMNNLVLKVNRKNGKVTTMGGMTLGKYRPKKFNHASFMRENIVKFSPYHIKLRQMMAQQQMQNMYATHGMGAGMSIYGPMGDESAINVYGRGGHYESEEAFAPVYGRAPVSRGSAGITGWGVTASGVHGVFAEDTWGNFRDNVWGGTHNNIWGGLGDDGGLHGGGSGVWGKSSRSGSGAVWGSGNSAHPIWGAPGKRIFGTGRPGQKNYLAKALWTALGMMNIGSKLAARGNARFAARVTGGTGRSAR